MKSSKNKYKDEELRAYIKDLFRKYAVSRSPEIRDELIKLHSSLAEYLVRKYCHRGEPYDDLLQVGYIGLLKAIERFSMDRGVEFSTYATPTIVGELKRHFRDKGWAIRVPRRLQMRDMELNQAIDYLSQELSRAPTIKEIAKFLNVSDEEIIEILESSQAHSYLSLDNALSDSSEEKPFSLLDYIGEEDLEFTASENRALVENLLSVLSKREQKVVYMRFFQGMTQIEIAKEMDISQMHVSRLLCRIIDKMRKRAKSIDEIGKTDRVE